MNEDVIHPAEDFCKLPWHTLKPGTWGTDWSNARGGYGLPNNTMTITTFKNTKELEYEIWIVPPALQEMIEGLNKMEVKSRLDRIQSALGFKN